MKKKIFTIILVMILSLLCISGCFNKNLNEIHVNINGGGDYDNIQEAIENVAVGGTIYVGEGSYHELLKISKSINLIGEDNGKTKIIQPDIINNIDSVIRVVADNCVIKGFNIICDKDNVKDVEIIGINISSSNNTISNNVINGSGKGIYLNKNTENNNISSNIISNSSNGIFTFFSVNNKIFKDNVSSCIVYGIYIFASDNNTISNNIIFDNNYGVRIKDRYSTKNIVFNNYIYKNKQGVLCCCGANDNIFYNNIFKKNEFWNAADEVNNQWDNGFFGNYWDDYTSKYSNATQINGIWDTPYNIKDGDNIDRYPLVYQPNI